MNCIPLRKSIWASHCLVCLSEPESRWRPVIGRLKGPGRSQTRGKLLLSSSSGSCLGL
uniref:Uncharacterized protein n=1 Tax=Anguilla anguilla TaxID=7936 RepID=A0A0E9W477_ANGAN